MRWKSPLQKLLSALPFVILSGLGIFMAGISWRKWPDILIDFGREVYDPWQINSGRLLYKDIHHLYGPLSQYINAFLFRLFGTSLTTLIVFNLCLITLLSFLIYHFFKKTCNKITATAACAVFLGIFAFSQYVGIGNYNFVCPYSHELLHGTILSFVSLCLFLKYVRKNNWFLAVLLGFIQGAVFLTKVEVFIAAFPAIICGLILFVIKNRLNLKYFLKLSFMFGAGFIILPLLFFCYFRLKVPAAQAINFIFTQYSALFSEIPRNAFCQTVLGMDNPLANIKRMLIPLAFYFIIPLLILFLTRKIPKIFFILLLSFAPILIKKIPWLESAGRPLPLIALFTGAYLFGRLINRRKNGTEANQLLGLFVFSLFSFLFLMKMLLNAHVFHYGFALAMPGSLLLSALFVHLIPLFFARDKIHKAAVRICGLLLITIAIIAHINISGRLYYYKDYLISSGYDSFFTYNPKISKTGPAFNAAISYIEKNTDKNASFIVLPEGVILNYLTRRKNPCFIFEFTPGIVIGEDKILSAFKENPPDYVIITERDTSEHGARYIGQDYGIKLFNWVRENYTAVFKAGNIPLSGQGFGIIIAKRISG